MPGLHRDRVDQIQAEIEKFSADVYPLLGVVGAAEKRACAEQLVSSMRRVDYVRGLAARNMDTRRADPLQNLFDPLMAATLAIKRGDVDEAWWLTFLATHFGKHAEDGWLLTRDFYGAFGMRSPWTWLEVSRHPAQLSTWLEELWPSLVNDGVPRRFSNHRKYESKSPEQMKSVLGSYIELVTRHGDHRTLMEDVHKTVGQHPHHGFHELYQNMTTVRRFGRLATFDFLAMVGKLGIAPIEPGSAYLAGATGPLKGAKLFVFGDTEAKADPRKLDEILAALDAQIKVGKQVLEDALCNWQKTPNRFVLFRG